MPKKKIRKSKNADFSSDFNFVSSVNDYNYDAWADVSKYMKKKALPSSLDAKIQKIRRQTKAAVNEEENQQDEGVDENESVSENDDDNVKPGKLLAP